MNVKNAEKKSMTSTDSVRTVEKKYRNKRKGGLREGAWVLR